ncbi:MAG TPA: ATP-binding protein [Desulfobacterales bacterium]|nr:ATP-binding protein [Desulfobacterales bacterium]HIP38984.1 ATP-binding protein [Desulfocapsa sulfexigens]
MALLTTLSDVIKGCPRNIKRRLLRDILIILFVTSGAILAIVLVQGIKTQRDISTAIITKANRQVKTHFKSFTEPLSNTLKLLGKWGEAGLLKLDNPKLLATQLQALMEIQPNVHAISLADEDGNDIHLSHYNQQWFLHEHQQSKAVAARWVEGDIIDIKESNGDTFNPAAMPWFRGAMTLGAEKEYFLTAPYILKATEESGITASLRWARRSTPDRSYVSAISFTTNDLMAFMKQVKITANSQILLLQKSGSYLNNAINNTLAADTPSQVGGTALSKQLLETVIQKLIESNLQDNQVISIKNNGQTWWLGLSPLYAANNDVWVAVLIPEDDIFADLNKQWLRFGLVAGSILLAGIIMTIFLVRRYSHQLKDLPQQHIDRYGFENEILALIQAGESGTLEFKSTMRTNLKTGKVGKEIELAWLKAVVAFMNSDGGILLIGVDDAGEIPGIDVDNFANEDKCRLHFKNLLNNHIGAEFTRFIHLKIVSIKEKTILVVECERVRRPVFLLVGKNEDFFIRSGPSSMKLSMSQMVKYLSER